MLQQSLELIKVVILCIIGTVTLAILHHLENLDLTINNKVHITEVISDTTKVTDMRITAYTPTGNKTALGEDMIPGKTAAVSPACNYLLGEWVYIRGHGLRYVNDVTASWLDDEFGVCTLDLAVPTQAEALKVGSSIKPVVKIIEEIICNTQTNN